MTNEEQEVIAQNDTEETVNDTQEEEIDFDFEEESTDDSESVEDLKKKLQTLEAQKNHWKKKATATKQPAEKKETKTDSTLSFKDQIALAKHVEVEDIDEVVEFATYKKISISEAINNPTLKAILSDRQEQRKSAQATNTGTSRKSTNTVSDETLLENAKKGQMPDEKDLDRLIDARLNRR